MPERPRRWSRASRPAVEIMPALYHPLLETSGMAWIAAFGLYLIEHAPMLTRSSLKTR